MTTRVDQPHAGTHPFAFIHPNQYQNEGLLPPHIMDNEDPTNEFMYQIPVGSLNRKPPSDAIDPIELRERLEHLGLPIPDSTENLLGGNPPATRPLSAYSSAPFTAPEYNNHLASANPSPYFANPPDGKDPLRRWPTVHDPLGPDDSISMYRPRQYGAPAPFRAEQVPSIRTARKGGTDVDYGERTPGGLEDAFSVDDGVTMNTPKSATYLDHTAAPGSAWTRTDTGGGMRQMRDRLLAEQRSADLLKQSQIDHNLNDAVQLASALARLEAQQDQLRDLHAHLISEQVHRRLAEDRVSSNSENMAGVKNELATAIRALRSARDDARLNEQESSMLKKSFDTAQVQLRKWELEVAVRNARTKGIEEGRIQAFQEAARWMGNDPPIPVEPIDHIPDVLLGQQGQDGGKITEHLRHNFSPPLQHHGNGSLSPNTRQQFQPMVFPDSNTQTHGSKPGSGYPSQRTSPEDGQRLGTQPQSTGHHQSSHPMPPPGVAPSQISVSKLPALQHAENQTDQGFVPIPEHILPASMVIAQRKYMANQKQHSQPQSRAPTASHMSGRQDYPLQPQFTQHHPSSVSQDISHSNLERTPRNAADVYLDRVDHDPALQNMLSGVNAGSFHPGAYTDHGGHISDKPLPDPFSPSNQTRAPSTAMGTLSGVQGGKSRRRDSLSNGINPAMMMPTIPDGDRYPLFPGTGSHGGMQHVGHRRIHSRNASIGSVDPAGFALPPSTMQSANVTPQTFHRMPMSVRQTPQSRARSRMAGALRNDGDMPAGELSQIFEEEDLQRQRTRSDAGVGLTERERTLMQSDIMRNMNGQPAQLRKAPSMPPPRHQPRPVMPGPLGRSTSEAHHPPSRPRVSHQPAQSVGGAGPRGYDPPFSHPMYVPPGLAPAAVSAGVEDVQGPRHSALGLEGIEAQSGGANALGHTYDGSNGKSGSGLGSFFSAIRAPTITIQPPSSQAISHVPSQVASAKSVPALLPALPQAPSIPAPKTPTVAAASPIIQQQPRIRETTTVREYFDDPTPMALAPTASVKPHEVPLPRSRAGTVTSMAGTAGPTLVPLVSAMKHPHDIPLPVSRAPTVVGLTSAQAHNIPLPASKSHAPTAYDGSPPDLLSPKTDRSHRSHRSTRSAKPHVPSHRSDIATPVPVVGVIDPGKGHTFMPSISVIDYAIGQPLPDSRATTMYGTPKAAIRVTVPSEVEENTRRNAKTSRKPVSTVSSGNGNGRHGGTNEHSHGYHQSISGQGFDPRHIPLPASRAPTIIRPRASTYARTEGTIDEVTEEESGRENKGKKKW